MKIAGMGAGQSGQHLCRAGQRRPAQGNGAVICTRQQLTAIDQQNYIVPIWMI